MSVPQKPRNTGRGKTNGKTKASKTSSAASSSGRAINLPATPPIDESAKLEARKHEINKTCAAVMHGTKFKVMEQYHDRVFNRDVVRYIDADHWKAFHQDEQYTIQRNGYTVTVDLGTEWLSWPKRRKYKEVLFDPSGKEHPGCYNLWQGIKVKPRKGKWDLFDDHILWNICNGDYEVYEWLITWIAQALREPDKKPGTAIVIRSTEEGTGKSFFARYIRLLFGQHGISVASLDKVFGRFNYLLQDCLFLAIEEASYSRNNAQDSFLKSCITEDTITIEPKGIDTKIVPCHMRVMILSNDDKPVKISASGRRYLVLNVNPQKKGNTKYFEDIARQMDNGGLEAFYHDLLEWDLNSVNLRIVPNNEALVTQKLLHLPSDQQWWYDKLDRGSLLPESGTWGRVSRSMLTSDYEAFMKTNGRSFSGPKSTSTALGMFLRKMTDSRVKDTRTGPLSSSGQATWEWVFPSLAVCRQIFARSIGAEGMISWSTPESEPDELGEEQETPDTSTESAETDTASTPPLASVTPISRGRVR